MFHVLPLDLTQAYNSPFSFLSVVYSLPFPKCPSSTIHLACSYLSFQLCSNVATFANSAKPSFTGGSDGKESACHAGDPGVIPGLGRSPGEGNGYPLPLFLPGEFHGQRSLDGLQSMGSQRVRLNGVTNTFTFIINVNDP